MFTGLVQDVGIVANVREGYGVRALTITPKKLSPEGFAIGASICCNGVCLSITETNADGFTVEATKETLACTTLSAWQRATLINLEPSLRLGDELGGHFVFGHVDGIGECTEVLRMGEAARVTIRAHRDILELAAPKGSIAIDGISLTVNEVMRDGFSVMLIPHTLKSTSFVLLRQGTLVNIESDMLARYALRRNQIGRAA